MIKVNIVADSISPDNTRITTMELEYPRFIHAEFMTHRALSKNASSSRAIPIKTMHENILKNTATPVYWGKNQPGMSAKEELEADKITEALQVWAEARDSAIAFADKLSDLGVHKQIANRLTEPFQIIKTLVTGTDWNNFFWLRDHPDAQPEFKALAYMMKQAMSASTPRMLHLGEWHLPYVPFVGEGKYKLANSTDETLYDLEEARIISTSCSAQVSYRKSDDSLDKAKAIYGRLVESEPVHASPTEHQATPIMPGAVNEGVTSYNYSQATQYSGNLRGWVQFRQTIKNNYCPN